MNEYGVYLFATRGVRHEVLVAAVDTNHGFAETARDFRDNLRIVVVRDGLDDGARALGRLLWKRGDGTLIDGAINGLALGLVPWFTRLAGRLQTGYVFTYAFAMVIGIVVLITIMAMTVGAN
jgi:hypothetical protein